MLLTSWKIFILLIFLTSTFLTLFFINQNNLEKNFSINGNFYVNKKISSGIIFSFENKKIYAKTYKDLQVDDYVEIESTSVEKIEVTNSFEKYLKSEGIDYIAKNPNVRYLGYKNTIKRKVNIYFTRGPSYYSRYAPLLFLGKRYSKNEVIVNKITTISVLHLFTVSGFHINIIFYFLKKLLFLFGLKNKKTDFLIMLLLIIYILIMSIPIAALRALCFLLVNLINKNYLNKKFDKLNLLAFVMLLFFLFNPYMVFSLSFVFSFLMTYIVLLSQRLRSKRKYILKIKQAIVVWLFSLSINLYLNNELNFSSFFTNIVLSPIVSFSYILTFMFFWLKPVLDNFYYLLDVLINLFVMLKLSVSLFIKSDIVILLTYFSIFMLVLFIKKNKIDNLAFFQKNIMSKLMNRY